MTIPHPSGTAGVTLSRSYGGESVLAITSLFPHGFDRLFAEFANQENRLPIDQHLLPALVAPRPLMASDGVDDAWADPASSSGLEIAHCGDSPAISGRWGRAQIAHCVLWWGLLPRKG